MEHESEFIPRTMPNIETFYVWRNDEHMMGFEDGTTYCGILPLTTDEFHYLKGDLDEAARLLVGEEHTFEFLGMRDIDNPAEIRDLFADRAAMHAGCQLYKMLPRVFHARMN